MNSLLHLFVQIVQRSMYFKVLIKQFVLWFHMFSEDGIFWFEQGVTDAISHPGRTYMF